MKGPGLYSDIGKKAKDLLTRDYNYDQKLSISTCTASGLGVTSTAVKKGRLYTADVVSQLKYKQATVDVKFDANSNISSTITVSEIFPSTKAIATIKFPDSNSGKLEVQHFHHHAAFSSSVGFKQSPTIDVSATIGAQGVAFGAEVAFDTASKAFTKYGAALSLTKPSYVASLILENKGDSLRASYMHHIDEKQKICVVNEFTRKFSSNENIVTVGGSYALDNQTTVRARLNNNGKLGALLQHELKPKSILTLSGEFDTKAMEQHPKFGLALALKP